MGNVSGMFSRWEGGEEDYKTMFWIIHNTKFYYDVYLGFQTRIAAAAAAASNVAVAATSTVAAIVVNPRSDQILPIYD